ncbi:hypothetical protein LLH06_01245 [Mucilaginibacter daejeonensis]|uniref:hypothetical protein n=1 Tax=Mucilaginibacter daejeonensis TaxID=398049 RepID=UPI001D177BD3|nr:hypothetical protein [Mucilaginibacter daejeonensis]UEG53597.1 hypothetical protein LLH06_01245 [Mucilaginibacter daejeonensis]
MLHRFTLSLLFLLFFLFTTAQAQRLSRIVVDPMLVNTVASPVRFIEFREKDVIIRVNANGSVKVFPVRGVRVSYYSTFDGDHRNGKLKRAGETLIDYDDGFNDAANLGKPKLVGNLKLIYNDKFSMDNIGKLSMFGNMMIKYVDRFDGFDTPKGLIKAIGNMPVVYYTKFDGFDNIGKIRKVGDAEFIYFDRFSVGERIGDIKSISADKNPFLELADDERYY